MDEDAGELEPALHPAREAPGPTGPDRPQVDQFEDLAGPPATRPEEHPEQRADEVDVLAHGQVGVEHERLGHVPDPLARLAPEDAGDLAQDGDLALGRLEGAGQQADRRGLARARRPDEPEDGPGRDDQRDVVDGELAGELDARALDDDRGRLDDWVDGHWGSPVGRGAWSG